MTHALRNTALVALLLLLPGPSFAVSAVFSGDPVNASTGLPYELLPGLPLVQPGPDGLYGTADDTVDTSLIGDIDMVVRSGSLDVADPIPPPTALGGRAALPVGVAGSTASGGVEVPFTVFLSDGVTSHQGPANPAPAGHLLAAADMDGIPVIVAAFADFDGDGFIGPTDQDASGFTDNRHELSELQPVGRAVALFSGGVAHGTIAVSAGLPASRGGLRVALTAVALTGPFDPNFFGGNIPSGPGISTALPFILQRDLTSLIRDRAVPVGPTTTLQPVIDFAALPSPTAGAPFALPLDGTCQTIDVAVVRSQPAVRAVFRADIRGRPLPQAVNELVLGTQGPASHRSLRLVPVDRWGNPADPDGTLLVSLYASPPLQIVQPRDAQPGTPLSIRKAGGVRVVLSLSRSAPDGAAGALTVERDGVVVGALPYRVDAGMNEPPADIRVPSAQAPTIQAAIDHVTDQNNDGALVIAVGPGLFRENIVVNRSIVLRGNGAGSTIIDGSPHASVVTISAPHATIQGVSAIGGALGFAINAAAASLTEVRAYHNVGAGIAIAGADARIARSEAVHNGADGVSLNGVSGLLCTSSNLVDNGGAGLSLTAAQNGHLDNNLITSNATGGVRVVSADAATVIDNQIGGNFGSGVQLFASQHSQIIGNLCAGNDEDGVQIDSKGEGTALQGQVPRDGGGNPTTDNLISGNTIDSNHGYGLFIRRSPNDDFSAASGTQAPPGDNASTNNRKGDVLVRQ